MPIKQKIGQILLYENQYFPMFSSSLLKSDYIFLQNLDLPYMFSFLYTIKTIQIEKTFYFYPTMKKNAETEPTYDDSSASTDFARLQPLLSQLIILQYKVNSQFLKNSILVKQHIQKELKERSNNNSSLHTAFTLYKAENFENKCIQIAEDQNKKRRPQRSTKKFEVESQGDEYKPSDDEQYPMKLYKISETKNVPKNFGKAILKFLRKNDKSVQKVLRKMEIDERDFLKVIEESRDKINTIADLRSLWIEGQNKYAKSIRILSSQYLRKFNLNHIFNSRVENHSKHLKYRNKILKALECPKQFTSIKDY